MSGTYQVVPYTPALEAQIARLQMHLWSRDPARNAAYLRWKYADNPYLREVLIRVALRDGEAVAMRGLYGALWEADGAAASLLPCADDFVVAPPERNSGVARQVLQASLADGAQRGFSYALNLSAGPVTFVASLAAGWRSAGPYRSMRRERPLPSRWRRGLARLRRGAAPEPFDRFDRGAAAAGPLSAGRAPRPEAMAALIRGQPWDGRIRHVRDARYLDWRFRNPLHDYRFLYWDEGGLQGYLVLQCYLAEGADRRRVNVVDWEAVDGRVRAALLAGALQRADVERVHLWATGADESVDALVRQHGFVAENDAAGGVRARSRGLLVCRLAAAAGEWRLGRRNLLELSDWDLRMLYSMAG